MHRPVPGFLIVGTPRSGTTLVQRLACELPGVRVPPETHFLSLLAPGLLAERAFPLAGDRLRAAVERFLGLSTSQGLTLDPAAVADRLGGRAEHAFALFGALVAELAGDAVVYGEKTPNHLLWWRPLARAVPALRFVAVVRDPRAVVASYRTSWGARSYAVLAERWASDQREVADAARLLGPERLLVLRYEDVVTDPGAARRAIGALLGLDGSAPVSGADGPEGLFLPWERWKAQAVGDVTPARVEAWREVLLPHEHEAVAAIARREMARFGYPAPGRRDARRAVAALPARDQWLRVRFRVRRGLKLARFNGLGRDLVSDR